jgi:hypothetical protein
MPSGYFSAPSDSLDPSLFDGDRMRPEVRSRLLDALYAGLQLVGFSEPWEWARAWLTGSGASYQWKADRGNGDLDVLFGADYTSFLRVNPWFPPLSMAETAMYTDQILRDKYWPRTSAMEINGSTYEVTFFWNPTTGEDIRDIHPYSAYSLTDDSWTIHPPELPVDPQELYPQHYFEQGERDTQAVNALKDMHDNGGSLGRAQSLQTARFYWDRIHGGRKEAFSGTGAGYGDFHNFRWQYLKSTGAMEVLRDLVKEADMNDPFFKLDSPADLITRAALRYGGARYWA